MTNEQFEGPRHIVTPTTLLPDDVRGEIMLYSGPRAAGELAIRWREVGGSTAFRLEVFDDAIPHLLKMTAVLSWLASMASRSGKRFPCPSVETISHGLARIGYPNATPDAVNHGSPGFAVIATADSRERASHPKGLVHIASTAWKALEWCRRSRMPVGTILNVHNSAIDADPAIEATRPIATFLFDGGDAPEQRDATGRLVSQNGN